MENREKNEAFFTPSDQTRHIKEEALKTADEIYEAVVISKENPKMRESIFAGYFLPIMLGKREDTRGDWVGLWTSTVGSISSSVDIVSDNGGGYLFTVPPLLHTTKLGFRRASNTMNDVVAGYNLRAENPMANASGYMSKHLGAVYKDLIVDIDLTKEEKAWRDIIGRYGYLDGDDKEEETKSVDDGDLEDLLIFD